MMRRTDGSGLVKLDSNIEDADRFYEALLAAHEGLSMEQSFELNARLLMLLANQVGDGEVLAQCLELARTSARKPST